MEENKMEELDGLEKLKKRYREESGIAKMDPSTLLATMLMEKGDFLTKKGNVHWYNRRQGIWRDDGEDLIRSTLRQIDITLNSHTVNEVVSKIKDKSINNDINFNPAIHGNYVNLSNGVFDMAQFKLKPHAPHYYFVGRLPVKFDMKATCPKIMKFLIDLTHPEERSLVNLLEEMAYILIDGTLLQKGFIHLGYKARNGKSTLAELEIAFLGADNVALLTISQMSDKQFLPSKLFGKLANIGAEIKERTKVDEGVLKKLITGDMFTADIKFRQPFDFKNKSKIILTANTLPWANTDPAWNRRWQIVEFKNRFVGKNDDKFIVNKITTEEELSGLFNLLMFVRKELLGNASFTCEDTEEITERKYAMGSGDSVKLFYLDMIEKAPGNQLEKNIVYKKYAEYCNQNGLKTDNEKWFGRNLSRNNDIGFTTTHTGEVYYYVGLKLKDSPDKKMLTPTEPRRQNDLQGEEGGYFPYLRYYFKNLLYNKGILTLLTLPTSTMMSNGSFVNPAISNYLNPDVNPCIEDDDGVREYCELCGNRAESHATRINYVLDKEGTVEELLFMCDSCIKGCEELENVGEKLTEEWCYEKNA